jgi:hypothetical protein
MIEVREPENRLLQGVGACHESSMASNRWDVNYIITLNCCPGSTDVDTFPSELLGQPGKRRPRVRCCKVAQRTAFHVRPSISYL